MRLRAPTRNSDERPPNSTITWCPLCGQDIYVRRINERRPLPTLYAEEEAAAELHMETNHRIRYTMWKHTQWAPLLRGLRYIR